MNLLAFETSSRWLSVALWQDGALIERKADMPNSGSEVLLPWAHQLLAEAELTFKQLDGLAFGAGPGGFTGLRLGCGVTQGLAWGLDRPVASVGSLAAMALNAGNGDIWTVLDARMNEVYAAAYRVVGDEVSECMAPVCAPPGNAAVSPAPTSAGGEWLGVGDGFFAYGEALATHRSVVVKADVWPTAAAVARLAAAMLAAGGGVGAAEAQPLYVRNKVALTTAERLARGGVR